MSKIALLSFAAAAAVTFISGCAVKNPYIAPVSGDTAKIRIVNNSSGTTLVSVSSSCEVSSAKSLAGFSKFLRSDTSRVGMLGDPAYEGNQDVMERVIEANKESQFFVAYQGANGLFITSCFLEGAFTPQKDGQYEMNFTTQAGKCNLSVQKLSEADGKILKERVDSFRVLKKDECR